MTIDKDKVKSLNLHVFTGKDDPKTREPLSIPSPSATTSQIEQVERVLGVAFPDDYKSFMMMNNGGIPLAEGVGYPFFLIRMTGLKILAIYPISLMPPCQH